MDFGPYLFIASLEGAITAAVLALTAVGLSIVFGIMRIVNVAHGEFYMLGAVIAWWITNLIGGHPALGFAAALVITPIIVGGLAVMSDHLILRKINYDPERTIVATIGLLYVIQQTTLMTFGPEARPVEAPFNKRIALPWFEYGEQGFALTWPWGLSTTTYKLAVIGAAVFILLMLWLLMTRTRIGLLMRATQLDREMAMAHGIPSTSTLFNGRGPTFTVVYSSYHWWAGQRYRNCCCGVIYRPERRNNIGFFHADTCKNYCNPGCSIRTGFQAAGYVWKT